MNPIIPRRGVASRAVAHGETLPAAAAPLAAVVEPATIRRAGLNLVAPLQRTRYQRVATPALRSHDSEPAGTE